MIKSLTMKNNNSGLFKRFKGFKNHEIFQDLKIPGNIYFFVRCDGRNFKKLLNELGFRKPFDEDFMRKMVETAKEVFRAGFNPLITYLFSDEINFLFYNPPFKGRLEKLNSIIPSILSSKLALLLKERNNEPIAFDARLILLDKTEIIKYLNWRQKEAWRNHNNSYAFYLLLRKGYTKKDASKKLHKLKTAQLHELVFNEGINLAETPTWQRKGVLIYKRKVRKQGFNPLLRKKVEVERKIVYVEFNPPLFGSEEGSNLINSIVSSP